MHRTSRSAVSSKPSALVFPQTADNDSGRVVGEALFRYEAFYKLTNLRFAGAIDARTDSHQQTGRDWDGFWWDRTRRRPLFAIRRLSATYTRGRLTVEAGKQLIRWGKADVLTPTDRFAPRDFLNVVESDFLPITAARVTYGTQEDTLELIFSPRLTPSRLPLLNQRWAVLPPGIPVYEVDPHLPGRAAVGRALEPHRRSGRVLVLFLQRLRPSAPLPGAAEPGPAARRCAAHTIRRCVCTARMAPRRLGR